LTLISEKPHLKTGLLILTILLFAILPASVHASWNAVSSPTQTTLESVFMVNANDGWAVGQGGVIIRWNGAEWKSIANPTTEALYSVFMVNAHDGWAVGQGGVILHWNGISWNGMYSPTTNQLNQVYMVNSNDGWAVGNGGTIIRWKDAQWTNWTSPTTTTINSLFMLNAYQGWAVGGWGWILHWNGLNWQQEPTPTDTWLYSVYMIDANNGWAAGGRPGELLQWNGAAWASVTANVPSTSIYESISMVNANNGWVLGTSEILHWNGIEWTIIPITEYLLSSIFMVDSNEGWAVGQSGTIMRWTNKPPVAAFEYLPQTQTVNKPINFDATNSQDPDGKILTYTWNFGDGNITTTDMNTITHEYMDSKSYTITLTVVDDYASTNDISKSIEITSGAAEGSQIWAQLLPLVSAIGIAAFSIVFVWRVMSKRKEKTKFTMGGPLPVGWQFYEGLTEGFPPGTIFRISPDKGRRIVGTIKPPEYSLEITECDEVVGNYKQTASMNTLIQFTGLKTKAFGKMNETQTLTLKMPGLTRETTSDVNLDPLVEQLLTKKIKWIREKDRYFVIREARKTEEINYQLTQGQVEGLGGEASLSKAEIKANNLSYSKKHQVIIQKFQKPMRVMFNAEEIKIERDDDRIRIVR
jgi:photosystem II stability/assembly factor-like uncharacterized protein